MSTSTITAGSQDQGASPSTDSSTDSGDSQAKGSARVWKFLSSLLNPPPRRRHLNSPMFMSAMVCFLILLTILAAYQGHSEIGWGLFLLTLTLGAALVLLRRGSHRAGVALTESHYERFRRLQGLYLTIPLQVRNSPAKASICKDFEALARQLDEWAVPETGTFLKGDASDHVHNLHLLFLQIASPAFLALCLPTFRNEFRDVVGTTVYEEYLSSPSFRQLGCSTDPNELECLMRADATFLINETRKQVLLKKHVESTRQALIVSAFQSWWRSVLPLVALLMMYLVAQMCVDRYLRAQATNEQHTGKAITLAETYLIKAQPGPLGAKEQKDPRVLNNRDIQQTTLFQVLIGGALLALVGIAGASGGALSVVQRVQRVTDNSAAGSDLRALSQSETAVFFAPVVGLMFALVLTAMLAGGVISGGLFPSINENEPWFYALFNSANTAKWMVWGFIAGFSERLVPDMLDTVAKERRKEGGAPAPGGAAAAAQVAAMTRNTPAAGATGAADAGQQAAEEEIVPETETNPVPVLHSHADAIPEDAEELTITGGGFRPGIQLFIDNKDKPPATLLEVTSTSLRVKLDPADIAGKKEIVVKVKNPGPDGGESHPLTIFVAPLGG